jgi:hypothetical protein
MLVHELITIVHFLANIKGFKSWRTFGPLVGWTLLNGNSVETTLGTMLGKGAF